MICVNIDVLFSDTEHIRVSHSASSCSLFGFVVEEAHLELGDKLCKDAEEGFCSGGLAVLSEVGGHLGELFHRPGLQGLQRLDCRVAVLQEALHGFLHIKISSLVTNPYCC